MDINNITNWIIQHESSEPQVYLDTKGIPTIGVGFNLEKSGAKEMIENLGLDYDKVVGGNQTLNQEQINQLLQHDLNIAVSDAQKLFSNFDTLPDDKQLVLVDMAYNLGYGKLSEFHEMINAVESNDWAKAADEMIDSKWFGDVKDRGIADVNVMRNGFEENLPLMHELHESSIMNEHDYFTLQPVDLAENLEQPQTAFSEPVIIVSELNNEVLVEHPQDILSDSIFSTPIVNDVYFNTDTIQLNPDDVNDSFLSIQNESAHNVLNDLLSNPATIIDTDPTIIINEQVDFIPNIPFNPNEVLISTPFNPIIEEPIDLQSNITTLEYDLNTPSTFDNSNTSDFVAIPTVTEFNQPEPEIFQQQTNETETPTISTNDLWANDFLNNSPVANTFDIPNNDNWTNEEPIQNTVDHSLDFHTINNDDSNNNHTSDWTNDTSSDNNGTISNND